MIIAKVNFHKNNGYLSVIEFSKMEDGREWYLVAIMLDGEQIYRSRYYEAENQAQKCFDEWCEKYSNEKVTVNGRNYFNDNSFAEVCKELDAGRRVAVYIDCIGFARASMEGARYRDAVVEKYGENVEVFQFDRCYYDEYEFQLKNI